MMAEGQGSPFSGAKAALFFGDKVLVYLRDDKPGLKYAAMWDFPGGGREGEETPVECLTREINEEFGLVISGEAFSYQQTYPSVVRPGTESWFMVAHLPESMQELIRFGDEGQRWELWTPEAIITSDMFVPFLQVQFKDYMGNRDIVVP